MTPILILAAGQSRRMRGRDKLFEQVDETPLLRLQAQRALAVSDQVYVTLPSRDHPRAALLDGLGVVIVPVPYAEEGIAASLRAGLTAIPPADAILMTLADLVEIEVDDLRAVLSARKAAPNAALWRGATANRKPGHPVLIPDRLRAKFSELTGDQGGAEILKPLAAETHLVPLPDHHALRDLDTPEDWEDWRATRQK